MEKPLFEIKCLSCGSTNVSVIAELDYDYEDNLVYNGMTYCKCNDCGTEDRY
jgi:ribosomal protein S27E